MAMKQKIEDVHENPSPTQLPCDGTMFIIDGSISSLRTAPGRITLLENQQTEIRVGGAANAIEGTYGATANAAMLITYDGEEVEKFVFRIDDFDVIGNFADVRFKDGDKIEAVVTRIDDVTLYAHAVLRMTDGWLWMPHCINKGRWELAKLNAKIGASVGIFGWTVLMALYLFSPIENTSFGEWALTMGSILLIMCTLGAISVYRSSIGDSIYAENIMSVLGFSNPKIVNLSRFCLARFAGNDEQHLSFQQIYRLRDALNAYAP